MSGRFWVGMTIARVGALFGNDLRQTWLSGKWSDCQRHDLNARSASSFMFEPVIRIHVPGSANALENFQHEECSAVISCAWVKAHVPHLM